MKKLGVGVGSVEQMLGRLGHQRLSPSTTNPLYLPGKLSFWAFGGYLGGRRSFLASCASAAGMIRPEMWRENYRAADRRAHAKDPRCRGSRGGSAASRPNNQRSAAWIRRRRVPDRRSLLPTRWPCARLTFSCLMQLCYRQRIYDEGSGRSTP